MRIVNLPIDIALLATQRTKEDPNFFRRCYVSEDNRGILDYSFNWENTPEGHSFWSKINNQHIEEYYDNYPFKINKRYLEVGDYVTTVPDSSMRRFIPLINQVTSIDDFKIQLKVLWGDKFVKKSCNYDTGVQFRKSTDLEIEIFKKFNK